MSRKNSKPTPRQLLAAATWLESYADGVDYSEMSEDDRERAEAFAVVSAMLEDMISKAHKATRIEALARKAAESMGRPVDSKIRAAARKTLYGKAAR